MVQRLEYRHYYQSTSVHGQAKEACGVPTLLGLALSLFGSYFRGYFFNRKSEIKKISFNAFSTLSNFFLHVTYFFLSSMSGLFWVFYQSSIEVSSMSTLFEGLFFPQVIDRSPLNVRFTFVILFTALFISSYFSVIMMSNFYSVQRYHASVSQMHSKSEKAGRGMVLAVILLSNRNSFLWAFFQSISFCGIFVNLFIWFS